jgi:hypothetical protein
LYSSPDIIRVIESRRIRRVGHGEMRNSKRILKGRDHSEDIGVNERVLLKWILGK